LEGVSGIGGFTFEFFSGFISISGFGYGDWGVHHGHQKFRMNVFFGSRIERNRWMINQSNINFFQKHPFREISDMGSAVFAPRPAYLPS
jgi:hypothetical protein